MANEKAKKTAQDYEAMLIASAKEAAAIARGEKKPARMYTMTARKASVASPPAFNRRKIFKVREQLGVSQPVMAKLLNVSAPTVRSWEQGVRVPDGAAARLLQLAARHPEIILAELSPRKRSSAQRRRVTRSAARSTAGARRRLRVSA